jgi:hypothetical protein
MYRELNAPDVELLTLCYMVLAFALRAYPKSPDFDTGFDTASPTQPKPHSIGGLFG